MRRVFQSFIFNLKKIHIRDGKIFGLIFRNKFNLRSKLNRDFIFSVNLKRIIYFLIILGIFLRILVFFNLNAGYDASYYITLGKGFAERGDFYLPFGDIETNSLEPTQSMSTRQAFPIYLSIYYSIFGFDYMITKIAVTILSFITLIVAYLTTKNLFGKDNAFVITGIVCVISTLIHTTGVIYSENMTYILFILGLWGLLKGDKYFPIGMICISSAYISRCYSLETFILLVSLFFSWLFFTKRSSFLNKYTIMAFICTIPFALLLYLFSAHSNCPINQISILGAIIGDPRYMFTRYLQLLFFTLIFTLGFCAYFLKYLRRTFSINNLLWIVVCAFILGIPLVMAYQDYVYQIYHRVLKVGVRVIFYVILPILWLTIPNIRYNLHEKLHLREIGKSLKDLKGHKSNYKPIILMFTMIALTFILMPELWLLFPLILGFVSIFFKATKWKITILCLMLMIVSVNDNTGVRYEYKRKLGEDINKLIMDGDVIMLDGIDDVKARNQSQFDRYILAPYVTKTYRIINFDSNETPDYIITQNPDAIYQNYTILKKYYDQDKKGIFTQIYNVLYKTIVKPPERERIPVYILWKKYYDDVSISIGSG